MVVSGLLRKIASEGWRQARKLSEIDASNPLTQDTASFIIDIAKEIIKPF